MSQESTRLHWETSTHEGKDWQLCEPGGGDTVAEFCGSKAEGNCRLASLLSVALPYVTLEDEQLEPAQLLRVLADRIQQDLSLERRTLRTYEVTASGFDGSTDATDDRVYWVAAESAEAVREAIDGCGAKFFDTIDGDNDIEFTLPQDRTALRAALLQWR